MQTNNWFWSQKKATEFEFESFEDACIQSSLQTSSTPHASTPHSSSTSSIPHASSTSSTPHASSTSSTPHASSTSSTPHASSTSSTAHDSSTSSTSFFSRCEKTNVDKFREELLYNTHNSSQTLDQRSVSYAYCEWLRSKGMFPIPTQEEALKELCESGLNVNESGFFTGLIWKSEHEWTLLFENQLSSSTTHLSSSARPPPQTTRGRFSSSSSSLYAPAPTFYNNEYSVVDEFVYKYIIYTPSVKNVLFKKSLLEEMHDFAIRTNKLHSMPGDALVLLYLKEKKDWVENEYGQWTEVKSTYNLHASTSLPLRKKRHISKSVKALIWEMYIGRHIVEHKCLCCKLRNIRIDDFHAGHVQSEYNGGSDELSNLRPICGQCNSGMRTTNMIEYVKRHGFYIG